VREVSERTRIYNGRLELERRIEEVWFKVNQLRNKLLKSEMVKYIQKELKLYTFDGTLKLTTLPDLREWFVAGIALVDMGDRIEPFLVYYRFRDEEGLEYIKMMDIRIMGSI
jgi:hypothetical protein